jgi:electron transfer flavoprotein alpha subunit
MVLTYVEYDDDGVDDVSLEALTLARDVADAEDESLEAIAFGADAEGVAAELGAHGVASLTTVDHADLDRYAPEAYARAIVQYAAESGAGTVIAPGTDRGAETLSHVAAKLDETMAAEVTDVAVGDAYEVTRQRWGGTLIEHAELHADTNLLTVAANELSAAETGGDPAAVSTFTPDLQPSDLRVKLDRVEESDAEGIPLAEARVVVSGGRGTDGDFSAVEALAGRVPNAAVGSSRAAVNEGWRPHDDQIGQTGNKIAPELYIPCGISGAVQHMVGCKGAENILAINTDPEAAIMQKADYAIVADLHETAPAIAEELEARGHAE